MKTTLGRYIRLYLRSKNHSIDARDPADDRRIYLLL